MKVSYDRRTDTLVITLEERARVAEIEKKKPGILLGYDDSGNLVSAEIENASHYVTGPENIDFRVLA